MLSIINVSLVIVLFVFLMILSFIGLSRAFAERKYKNVSFYMIASLLLGVVFTVVLKISL